MKPLIITLAAAGLLALTACGPAGEPKVSARSQQEYDSWFSDTSAKMPPDDARILQTAQQEIKLDLMAHSNNTGTAAVDDAFLSKVDGMTTHQMMVLGLQDRIARLTGEHNEAQKLFDDNSKIHARPGDDASAAYVKTRVDEDRTRTERSAAALAATKADLARINK